MCVKIDLMMVLPERLVWMGVKNIQTYVASDDDVEYFHLSAVIFHSVDSILMDELCVME